MFNPILTVRNWQDFQHYKDRNPPWIKLHYELLTSKDWVMLDDASKLLAVVCMMLASRNNGEIEADPDYIQKVAHLTTTPDFKPLVKCGFLIIVADASNVLADAITKTEKRREETETEAEAETYKAAKPKKSTQTKAASRANPRIRLSQFAKDHPNIGDEWGEYATKTYPHLTPQDVGDILREFADYWNSGNAKDGGLKADWGQTWRGWLSRNAHNSRSGQRTRSPADGGYAAAFRSVVAARAGHMGTNEGDDRGNSASTPDNDGNGRTGGQGQPEIPF